MGEWLGWRWASDVMGEWLGWRWASDVMRVARLEVG